MKDRDRQILVKILKYCKEVTAANEFFHSDEALFRDEERGFLYRNSVCMSVLQIRELCKSLSGEFAEQHPGIPWKMMARMRDVLAHHYGGINMETTFLTATKDMPEVMRRVTRILEDEAGMKIC